MHFCHNPQASEHELGVWEPTRTNKNSATLLQFADRHFVLNVLSLGQGKGGGVRRGVNGEVLV